MRISTAPTASGHSKAAANGGIVPLIRAVTSSASGVAPARARFSWRQCLGFACGCCRCMNGGSRVSRC